MFIKPFKQKSNTQIKSTERKKLRSKVEATFHLGEDDLNKLMPNKATLNQLKLITYGGQTVTVYTCDRRPMFFEIGSDDSDTRDSTLLPTVYAMWILPNIVPTFTTHAAVLPRLAGGADLMLPGVIKQGDGYTTYGSHKRDAVVAVNLTSNRSAVGIGQLAKSSEDLYLSRNSGVCVKMLHVFGDKLWGLEPSQTLQIPTAEAVVKVPTQDEFPALGEPQRPPKKNNANNAESTSNEDSPDQQSTPADDKSPLEANLAHLDIGNDENVGEDEAAESPDDKLKRAFLVAVKKMGKNPPTPLLTSNFYRCHILTEDSNIDIKHTSYKKLSKFLQEMAASGYLTVKEETKGVEKIVAFNTTHPDIVNTILTVSGGSDQKSSSNSDGLFITEMRELYFVTEESMKFFNLFDVKLGEGLEPAQVKKYLKDYVCNKKLQDSANIRNIRLDEVLRELFDVDESVKEMKFDELLAQLTERMKHSYAMRNRNELKTSGKSVPIKMTLAKRSGNKTVTLIDHLEMFGIRLPEFAQACKVGVAASTSIYRPDCPGNSNKGQLLVQGNQIRFVHKLLTETYKIPPKYITGADLAKKEKKPKKK